MRAPPGHTSAFFIYAGMATAEIYTLSLHDALPICTTAAETSGGSGARTVSSSSPASAPSAIAASRDRKSTRLNSSHVEISYAVFCLKKKKLKRAERHETGY